MRPQNADPVSAVQIDALRGMLARNRALCALLERAPALHLPNWYLGAGCVAQSVWNVLSGFPPGQHIRDYDLVYYDGSDLSPQAEENLQRRAADLASDLDVRLDVKNQARVHLWYAS